MKKALAIVFASFLPLMIWKTSYKISCFSLIILAIMTGILFYTSFQLHMTKKRCFANCYFNQHSILYRFFTKKLIIFIICLFSSLVLTFSLSIAVIMADLTDEMVFLLDGFLILFLYQQLKKSKLFNEKVKYPILKHTVSWINGVLISVIYLFITLYQTPPSYLSNNLTKTVQTASSIVSSDCKIIDYASRLSAELSAEKWWLMINATVKLKNELLIKVLWILFLVGNYLAFYTFSRYITELLYWLKDRYER